MKPPLNIRILHLFYIPNQLRFFQDAYLHGVGEVLVCNAGHQIKFKPPHFAYGRNGKNLTVRGRFFIKASTIMKIV